MPTAPTLVASSFGTSSSGATATTGTVSWQTGDVVVAIYGNAGAAPANMATPTNTGSGLSWTVQQSNASASNCGGAVATAVATASSSGTVTAGSVTGPSENNFTGVYVFRGSAGVGNSAVSATTARTVSLTPTAADSAIAWGVFDWNADAAVALTPSGTSHSASSPGPSATPQRTNVAGQYTYYWAELDDQTSAGAVSYGVGGTGVGPFTIVAVEVKGAAGGGTNGNVNAVVATSTGQAVAPVVSGGGTSGNVNAVAATGTAAANAPVVSGNGNGTVAAVAAVAAALILAPTVSGSSTVTGGGPATATAAMVAPAVAGTQNPTVSAVKATANAQALAPFVSAGGSVNVDAVKATATAAAAAPVVSGTQNPTVNAVVATSTGQAVAPVVSGNGNGTVAAVVATATAVLRAPFVSAGGSVNVSAVAATATAAAVAPAVTAVRNATVTAVTATATAAFRAPVVSNVVRDITVTGNLERPRITGSLEA